jgi:hypothetical protein
MLAFLSGPTLKYSGPRALVTLTADLSSLPTDKIPIRLGKDGLLYYVGHFQIRIKFHSAHTTYSLWYQDKCYGAVDAEYA